MSTSRGSISAGRKDTCDEERRRTVSKATKAHHGKGAPSPIPLGALLGILEPCRRLVSLALVGSADGADTVKAVAPVDPHHRLGRWRRHADLGHVALPFVSRVTLASVGEVSLGPAPLGCGPLCFPPQGQRLSGPTRSASSASGPWRTGRCDPWHGHHRHVGSGYPKTGPSVWLRRSVERVASARRRSITPTVRVWDRSATTGYPVMTTPSPTSNGCRPHVTRTRRQERTRRPTGAGPACGAAPRSSTRVRCARPAVALGQHSHAMTRCSSSWCLSARRSRLNRM